jgi:HEAT repeat protein
VFNPPDLGELASAGGTLLEAISAGITGRVAVLGDRDITGTGLSYSEITGIGWREIADGLSARLIRKIIAAGTGGGPLKPLADQLNHDATHLQNATAASAMSAGFAAVLAEIAGLRGLVIGPGQPTATEFAEDLRRMLEGLAWQAGHGRLPPYLSGRAEVMMLARQVSVRLGVRPEARGRGQAARSMYALAADRNGREGASAPQPWLEVAARHDRLVVLADPGLGKSWLIRTETLRLARAALDGLDRSGARVIVPVPLRCDQLAGADGLDLPSRAAACLAGQGLLAARARDLLAAKIDAGEAVLLLDALDELTSAEAGSVRALISDWAERPGPRARCVITSRIAGYTGPPLPDAAEVELQPYTPDDVQGFIRAWQLPPAGERRLADRANGDRAVAAMTRVPLLLAMLCSLASRPGGQALPATRADLYERLLRWFLTRAHRAADDSAEPARTEVEVEALLGVLAPVAFTFAASRDGWTDRIPAGDLLNAIRATGPALSDLRMTAVQVLTALSADAGVLVPDGDPTAGRSPGYLFLHRTFAEYLTARHLATLPAADWQALVAEHQWFDPDWEQVIPMLGAQLSREHASELITSLLASRPDPFLHTAFTAIRVAAERTDADAAIKPEQGTRMTTTIQALIRTRDGRYLLNSQLNAITSPPRPVLHALITALADPERDVRHAAAEMLAGREGKDVTVALISALADPHPRVREEAAEALAGREGQDVTAALFATLFTNPNWDVYLAAARALESRPGRDLTAALIAAFTGPDKHATSRAVHALARRPGQDVTAALLTALADHDDYVRRAAVQVLAGREGQDVTAGLLAVLADPDSSARRNAAVTLASRNPAAVLAGPDVIAALIATLTDPDKDVRQEAAEMLAGREPNRVIPEGQDVTAALITALTDPDPDLRRTAARGLEGRRGQDVTLALITALADPEKDVRSAAAGGLAGREGQDVTAALITALTDPDPTVRRPAAWGLAGREGQDVTAALITTLADRDSDVRQGTAGGLAGQERHDLLAALSVGRDEDVRRAAARALAGREGQDVTAALIAALADPDPRVRQEAARGLAGREGQDVTDALIAALADPDPKARWTAAAGLAGREGQDVTAALIAALADPRPRAHRGATEALAAREGQDATAALITLLADPDPKVRWTAAGGLAGREGQDVTAALITLLADPEKEVRRVTAGGLARRDGQDVTAALIAALTDPETDVRREAVEALAGWTLTRVIPEHPDATQELIATLAAGQTRVRWEGAPGVAGREGQDVTAALITALADRDRDVRQGTAGGLAGPERHDLLAELFSAATRTSAGRRRGGWRTGRART